MPPAASEGHEGDFEGALHKPARRERGDPGGTERQGATPVKHRVPERVGGRQERQHAGQLAQLDPDIEPEERSGEVRPGKSEFPQHAGKAETVDHPGSGNGQA